MYTLTNLPQDDYACLKLVVQELYPNGLTCPWQKHLDTWLTNKYVWCRVCRRKWSLKKSLGFGHAKLSWFCLLGLVVLWQGKLSPGDMMVALGLSYRTIQRWLERLRSRLPEDQARLAGLVEIDQSLPGRQKHGNQVLIMGVVDRDNNEIRIQEIADMEQDSIEQFLDDHVEPESLVHADAHSSHLAIEDVGYGLVICNHSRGHFGPTNRIEGVWSSFDRFIIRTRHQFLKRFLREIIREFCARRNHPELFQSPFTYLRGVLVPV